MLMVSIFVYNVSIQFLALFLNLCVIYSSIYLYSSTVGNSKLRRTDMINKCIVTKLADRLKAHARTTLGNLSLAKSTEKD